MSTAPDGPSMSAASGRTPLITVLGASGFLGSAVAAMLARTSVRLRLVARRAGAVPPGIADVETRAADLTRPDNLRSALAGADAVVHLICHRTDSHAWRTGNDPMSERVNVGMVHDLIDVARERPGGRPLTCLFIGSTSQVGLTSADRIDGSEPDRPASVYDRHKLLAEQALLAATAEGVLRAVSVRLPTVFGDCPVPTAVDRGVVTAMARRALAGEPLTVWRDGAIARDMLYVTDAARALVTALDHADALAGRHWVVGTAQPTSLLDLFTLVAEVVAERNGRAAVPVITVDPPAHATPPDFHSYTVDASAFHGVTGWKPTVTLRAGLERTVRGLADGGRGEPAGR
ncbi:NAD-dependent epimerase/dehydratase family protein [Streptomyces sp. NPDC058629]|uniref:NAD-dependent epimerase/dehydratase family protein n=1 Tax=Streptomyces sp. NPDC058629 TaxID=3346565 RepID=UPI00365F2AF9